MTPRFLLVLAAALALPVTTSSAPAAPGAAPGTAAPLTDPRALTYAPLRIALPEPETFVLKNGLVIYLLRDQELPIVDLSFFVHAGSIYDPPEKAGLASLATHLMRTGGTRGMTPDQVDETLETLPAEIEISASSDAVSGTLSCIKEQFAPALRILAAMLREPRFDEGRIGVEKAQIAEGIRRRWDDPGSIASINFRNLIYGADSPWARLDTEATIDRIGRDDLVAFHARYLAPGNVMMAVSGDFEPAGMKRLLKDTFGPWKGGRAVLPPVAKIRDTVSAGVSLIERPLQQSSLALGHLGVTRFDPDKFPLFLLNYILGEGDFSSRLMKEVRSNRGLAYSVGGGVGTDSDRGLFEITSRTRANATVEAIQAIRDVVKRLRDDGPTQEEILQAKEARINSFAFTVDGSAAYMSSYLFYIYYGYPADYLQTWRDRLSAVTRDDIMRAARRLLQPERMAILVVGDPKKFDRPLDSLGLGAPKVIRLAEDAPSPQR
jgi:predicted Zn-dependent peptidase